MSQAISTHTIKKARPASHIDLTSAISGLSAPMLPVATPLASLHQRFRSLSKKNDKAEQLCSALRAGPKYEAANKKQTAIFNQMLELQNAALEFPAQTVEDAAIQAVFAYYRVEGLTAFSVEEEPDINAVRTFLASVILMLGRIGNLDLDGLGFGDMGYLCTVHAPGRSAAA